MPKIMAGLSQREMAWVVWERERGEEREEERERERENPKTGKERKMVIGSK